jgi:hypothetical protein
MQWRKKIEKSSGQAALQVELLWRSVNGHDAIRER